MPAIWNSSKNQYDEHKTPRRPSMTPSADNNARATRGQANKKWEKCKTCGRRIKNKNHSCRRYTKTGNR